MNEKIKEEKEFNIILRLLAKTSMIVLFGLIFSKVVTYAFRIIIARYYGPEIYGVFLLGIMILQWFIAFSTLGLIEGILRFIPIYRGEKNKEKIKQVFKFTTTLFLFSSIFFAVFLFSFSEFISINIFHEPKLVLFLRVFSFVLPLSIFGNTFLATIKAHEKIKEYIGILNFAENTVKLLFLILFISLGLQIKGIALAYFLGIFTTFLLSYLFCKYKLPEILGKSKLPKEEKKSLNKKLLDYSLPLLFFGILAFVFYGVDSFLIAYFKTAREVGFYNAAVPIASLLTIVHALFLQLFSPIINRKYGEKDIKMVRDLSKQVVKWIFTINLPIFILIFIFPEVAINFLFGDMYLVAAPALRILAIGFIFTSVFSVANALILMIGKSKLILFDIVFAAILNIILNIILIPLPTIFFLDNSLGITGAAIATSISIIVFNLLLLFQVMYYLSIVPLKRKMITILLCSLIPIALVLYFKQFIIVNILSIISLFIFFILLYIILIFIFKGFDKRDLEIIRSLGRKLKSRVK